MKKTIWGIASILAAGALVFGTLGCDSGNDDYVVENPTTTESLGSDSYAGAVWDFSSFVKGKEGTIGDTTIPAAATQLAANTEIDASTEGKATLVATNLKCNTNTSTVTGGGVLSASKGSATLASVASGYQLKLTLETNSNIAIKAVGAGAADAVRYLAIGTSADNLIVYKGNLGNTKTVDFMIQGAPAGDYIIFLNGASIAKIDTSNATTYKEAKGYTSDDDLTLVADATTAESLVDNITFTLTDNSNADVTADAAWTIVTGSDIATVSSGVVSAKSADSEGAVTVRARIGMFYQEKTVNFTKCTHQVVTFFAADNMPVSATELGTDWSSSEVAKKILTATTSGNSYVTVKEATIAFGSEIVDWTTKPTAVKAATSTSSEKFGVYWKDKYGDSKVTSDLTVATLTFTVSPVGGSASLDSFSAEMYTGRAMSLLPTVAGTDGTAIVAAKTGKVSAAQPSLTVNSADTTVTVKFYIPTNKKSNSSFGCQNISFYFSE